MLAAQGGHTETVKALIDAGAEVDLKGEFDDSQFILVIILD